MGPDDFKFILCKGNCDRQKVSFQSVNFPGWYLRHENFRIILAERDGSDQFDLDTTFEFVAPNCADGEGYGYFSFRSVNFPEHFLRHKNYELWLDPNDGSDQFDLDTTWCLSGEPVRFKSYNFRTHAMRHMNYEAYLHEIDNPGDPPMGPDDFLFYVRPGNWRGHGISMESLNFPGHFLRHQNFRLLMHPFEDSEEYRLGSTFVFDEPPRGRKKGYIQFQSVDFPGHALRHRNYEMWMDPMEDGCPDFAFKLKRDD